MTPNTIPVHIQSNSSLRQANPPTPTSAPTGIVVHTPNAAVVVTPGANFQGGNGTPARVSNATTSQSSPAAPANGATTKAGHPVPATRHGSLYPTMGRSKSGAMVEALVASAAPQPYNIGPNAARILALHLGDERPGDRLRGESLQAQKNRLWSELLKDPTYPQFYELAWSPNDFVRQVKLVRALELLEFANAHRDPQHDPPFMSRRECLTQMLKLFEKDVVPGDMARTAAFNVVLVDIMLQVRTNLSSSRPCICPKLAILSQQSFIAFVSSNGRIWDSEDVEREHIRLFKTPERYPNVNETALELRKQSETAFILKHNLESLLEARPWSDCYLNITNFFRALAIRLAKDGDDIPYMAASAAGISASPNQKVSTTGANGDSQDGGDEGIFSYNASPTLLGELMNELEAREAVVEDGQGDPSLGAVDEVEQPSQESVSQNTPKAKTTRASRPRKSDVGAAPTTTSSGAKKKKVTRRATSTAADVIHGLDVAQDNLRRDVPDPIDRIYNEVDAEFPKEVPPKRTRTRKSTSAKKGQGEDVSLENGEQVSTPANGRGRKRKARASEGLSQDNAEDGEGSDVKRQKIDSARQRRAERIKRKAEEERDKLPIGVAPDNLHIVNSIRRSRGLSFDPNNAGAAQDASSPISPATPSASAVPANQAQRRAKGQLEITGGKLTEPRGSGSKENTPVLGQDADVHDENAGTDLHVQQPAVDVKPAPGTPQQRKRRRWSAEDEAELERGLLKFKHAPRRWRLILDEGKARGCFLGRNNVDLKDKARQMKEARAKSGIGLGGFEFAVDRGTPGNM
ncbi:uncharacterized protein EV422DRAFT_525173 [Fimicolochytrium jonesii]|uniref:uncharacterized protein n=1 Tax=Fimicolochytrium jonesii TaxID=1396493 RepID=UPI0022FDF103|nr:uncharacterized protein EV422DRAFT_525173 [Fimicolochytrium jonesii]KAI8821977.1 hypothetical protein EV422DRAFT_525173 [Fimicolochytrium jonesii]